jgi:hypothetical protein
VDEFDLRVRRATYGLFAERGSTPAVAELARLTESTEQDIAASWLRLHDAHALVLRPATTEVWMLNPFSAVPTAYRVQADGRWWYGNCAWDAFGICAALGVDGRIETVCADCGTELVINVIDERPDATDLVFHCLVPAAHWWDDIGFT